jgi:hypothetical protein
MRPRWADIFGHHASDWRVLVELAAMAWRQAAIAAQTDAALASNLQCNSWSISGICYHLDSIGIWPDRITMEWAMSTDGAPPPVPFFVGWTP